MSAVEKNPSREGGRKLLLALFVAYLCLLAWIVLWKLEVPYLGGGVLRKLKLVPFAPGSGFGASAPFEVVANILLFVPFGLYLGLLAPSRQWWKAAGAVAGASAALEVIQYVLALGSSDATDLVVNTAGGLAGIGLLDLARHRLQARTTAVMTRICTIGTVFALLLTGVFVASPLRYAPPRDAAALSMHSVPAQLAGNTAKDNVPG
ncbi:VanZ family protein [Paeniglutamicibacter sp. ZC-3]|uniref:VanZ family protein n=1 Tax=Paeniglutamicibacter sp. ZC-3 TaxID=2986919 RepID=UPI0021F78399|nr:VanZ family protein [Paeniglutamicibacter sp. ZC-3]MCV9993190.1 VanZ family protein [Paeniglutamicibacter sp. ZC-3]